MYSLEDECCHTVARLAPELETGCRQLLYKYKSCEATQCEMRKCALCKLPKQMSKSFLADYGYRGDSRRTVSQELSIHHLWCILGPSKDWLSVWQMRYRGPLAPCRLSRVTTLRRVTVNGSLPKFWLYKAVVACSLTTCQVTVEVVELCLCFDQTANLPNKKMLHARETIINHTNTHLKDYIFTPAF